MWRYALDNVWTVKPIRPHNVHDDFDILNRRLYLLVV